ncbi:hypothetical protein KCV01_g6242, partial [Aureobasidium melanogenum]
MEASADLDGTQAEITQADLRVGIAVHLGQQIVQAMLLEDQLASRPASRGFGVQRRDAIGAAIGREAYLLVGRERARAAPRSAIDGHGAVEQADRDRAFEIADLEGGADVMDDMAARAYFEGNTRVRHDELHSPALQRDHAMVAVETQRQRSSRVEHDLRTIGQGGGKDAIRGAEHMPFERDGRRVTARLDAQADPYQQARRQRGRRHDAQPAATTPGPSLPSGIQFTQLLAQQGKCLADLFLHGLHRDAAMRGDLGIAHAIDTVE